MSRKNQDELLREVLAYLDKTHGLDKLYYPGSGWHRVPLETLGGDRIYHVSANENKGSTDFIPELHPPGDVYDADGNLVETAQEHRIWMQKIFKEGYFGVLGDDALHKYESDYRRTPFFEEGKFDGTLIWGIPTESAIEAIPEFRRVTKKGGLFILSNEVIYPTHSGDANIISETIDKKLQRLTLPGELSEVPVFLNYDR